MFKESLSALVSNTPPGENGGFVIYDAPEGRGSVQFSLSNTGLILYWPNLTGEGAGRLPDVKTLLLERGFVEMSPGDVAGAAKMYVGHDGLYALCGRCPEDVGGLTEALFRKVLGVDNLDDVEVTLEVDG